VKIAVVHDELMRKDGADQVTLCFHKIFPTAPIYTLAYRKTLTYPEFDECTIITSFFNKLAINEKILKLGFFRFGLIAMKSLNLKSFDVVLISSTYCAKYVVVNKTALVINFCHSPFRLAWYPDSYKEYNSGKGIKKKILNYIISILRKIDFATAQRTDYFIANASEMANKINVVYKPKDQIVGINLPVKCINFQVSEAAGSYFLVVCRLEYYKRVDIVIEAFNELNPPLIVVGKGSQESSLKLIVKGNVTFKGSISLQELSALLLMGAKFSTHQLLQNALTVNTFQTIKPY